MIYDLLLILYFLGVVIGLFFVFKKAGVEPWKALIPLYNIVVWIKVCGKSWRWYIYFLIPAINVFCFLLLVVETAKCFRRYGFWEQTAAVIFPWLYMPVLGLSNLEYTNPADLPPHKVSEARDWLDAIVFALVAAVIIRGNMLEFYKIPSSSMEKSLLVGDYLMVSKMAYGPRVSMTPLSFPLVHNVLPLTNGTVESYIKWPQLPYHRYCGFGEIKRFDAVVFNYPDGDTMCTAQFSNRSYHDLVREYGKEAVETDRVYDRDGNRIEIGKIRVRPVDKRENFIKRCIGLPGDDLQIVNQQVLINGTPIENPEHLQFTYAVLFKPQMSNPIKVLDELGVSQEDLYSALSVQNESHSPYLMMPLSRDVAAKLAARYDVADVQCLVFPPDSSDSRMLFPHAAGYNWSIDNFGPVHIPAKGETLHLTAANIELYRRLIEVYEGNTLSVDGETILINGEPTNTYTCRMNYYWMMGDNRHNSVDSRFWGFVPEDHIVGKASTIVFSRDKDHRKVRLNRLFKNASAIN
ncbi:MAG: S26 family signal peptidase [Bacteroidales bacterium]|nr:S26 family signal peptidase [Bacteroidales bacterium]